MSTKPPNWKIGSIPGHVWLSFSRGIGANPADDLPRLIFGDYLEGEGCHEYSEFIRVQIELAGMPPKRKNLGVTMGAPPTGVKVGGFIDLTLQTTGDGNPETFLRSLNMELGEIVDLFITSGDGGQWSEIRHAVMVYSYDFGRIRFRQTDLGPDPNEPRRNELTERQNHLLKTNLDEWTKPVKAAVKIPRPLHFAREIRRPFTISAFNTNGFRRGFVERLEVNCQVLAERADQILDVCPLTELIVTGITQPYNDAVMRFTGQGSADSWVILSRLEEINPLRSPPIRQGRPQHKYRIETAHYDVAVDSVNWVASRREMQITGLTNSRGEVFQPPTTILRPEWQLTLKLGKRVWHPQARKFTPSTAGAER